MKLVENMSEYNIFALHLDNQFTFPLNFLFDSMLEMNHFLNKMVYCNQPHWSPTKDPSAA
jgi:hypothetical protein